jgi:hypothetical protein
MSAMTGIARKHVAVRPRISAHSPLVLGCALLFGLVEVVALSRARWAQRRRG